MMHKEKSTSLQYFLKSSFGTDVVRSKCLHKAQRENVNAMLESLRLNTNIAQDKISYKTQATILMNEVYKPLALVTPFNY